MQRLFRSMRYLGLEPGMSAEAFLESTREVLARNLHLIGADDDYWVTQRVTPGSGDSFAGGGEAGPTIIIECLPLPLAERAPLYRDGVHAVTPSIRRTSPEAQSPRAKTHNYINLQLADREVKALDPQAWALLLDHNGNLCEGLGSNFFFVRNAEVLTPQARFVLPGVSRALVMDLCSELDIPCREADIDLFDAYTADEAFITSTSLCMVPLGRVNGRAIGDGDLPGPITRRLMDAYIAHIGFDFEAQYLRHLPS